MIRTKLFRAMFILSILACSCGARMPWSPTIALSLILLAVVHETNKQLADTRSTIMDKTVLSVALRKARAVGFFVWVLACSALYAMFSALAGHFVDFVSFSRAPHFVIVLTSLSLALMVAICSLKNAVKAQECPL